MAAQRSKPDKPWKKTRMENAGGKSRSRRHGQGMRPRHFFPLLKEAAFNWVDDGAMRLSSSPAYYAIFSLAPLLVILIAMAGLVFGEDAARGQLAHQIAVLAGKGAGEAIQSAVQSSAEQKSTSMLAMVLSTALMIFGAPPCLRSSSMICCERGWV